MVSESGSFLDFIVVLLPESERSVRKQDILSLSSHKPVLVSLYTHCLLLEDDVPVCFKKEDGSSSSVRLSSCRAEGMGGMGWGVPDLEYRSGSSGEQGEDPLLLSLPWLL